MRRRAGPRARRAPGSRPGSTRRSTTTDAKASASSRESPCSRSIRSSIPSTAISRRVAEVLVEAERQPGAVDAGDRPLEREVVAHVERDLRLDRRLDRRPRDLTVALGGVAVTAGEERAVDRDRQVERRPGDELLAVDVAAAAPRRGRRVDARLGRRHPEHAEERRQADRAAGCLARRPPSSSQSSRWPAPPNVTPHEPGTTSSIRTASTCPARAPRTSIGPASAWPVSSSGFRGSNGSSRPTSQPAFGTEKRTESPGST